MIGIVLFALLLWSLGPGGISGIIETIAKANPWIFGIALLFIIIDVSFKGLKQSALLKAFGKKISLVESMEVWLAGYLLGAVSPGRSGDFLRSVYFKKNFGIKTGSGLSAVLIDRLFDVGFLLLAAIAGFLYFSVIFNWDRLVVFILLGLLAVFATGCILITRKKAVHFLGRPFFRLLVPKKFKEKIRVSFHDFYEGFAVYGKKPGIIVFAGIITVISWCFFFFQAWLFALSLNIPVSFGIMAAIMPVITLVEVIPVSFSGIGTRDITLVGFFGLLGISKEAAISFSMTILLIEIIQALFGAFFLRKIKNL
ncbi:MAG: lysylphosphatidylglycerol synthase transmembrane domain-containing protein [Candidatus ainarchaeum sp.]|nr:lysylphosphatidylglycerol synthase transmembrane domain-containing protein [Candidatus ainarchaeum sp.]